MKIAILGADGSMGRMIAGLAIEDPEIKIVGAFTEPDAPTIGTDIGSLLGKKSIDVEILDSTDLHNKLQACKPDIAIDFTVAKATEVNAPIIVKNGIRMVIGTTGLSQDFMDEIKALIQEYNAPSIISSNMAVGMNLFMKIVGDVASALEGWDTEVIEAHHNRKKDAPSGTAITISEIIAKSWNKELDDIAKYGRGRGPAPRVKGTDELGIHAIRAGDIVGDHMVLFAGAGERIELVHRAHDRSCFASGAIKAAKFIATADEPRLYSMKEVLGL
ncbi:MAG TPA: 4-hydroxy-tetrahydrodipicolinate reductase [Candidatus Lokiarchaeia archaeon]|nr:4-hydroxy-tetrahydrodipicolinate reductase [Candidatus Lokiarchaeia archaeon]